MLFNGNLSLTEKQIEAARNRHENPATTIPSILRGFNNDVGYIKRGTLEFISNLESNGAGGDEGGWYPTADMVVDGGGNNPFQPFGENYGLPRKLHNIHLTAYSALIEQDRYYAKQVLSELVYLSNISHLDFSDQTKFDRNNRSYINPIFYVASKMTQYLNSYGLIYELIKDTIEYELAKDGLDLWFKNAADWLFSIVNENQNYWFTSGNWRDFKNVTGRTSPLTGTYTYYDDTSIGINEISDIQVNVCNNRIWNLVDYVGLYGLSFNDENYIDYHFDYFKLDIQIGFFPDSTSIEHFRGTSYNGVVGDIRSGVDYVTENIYAKVNGAHNHEVAVERGVLPMEERGKFYDYSTRKGIEHIVTNFDYDNTGGEVKNLKTIILNLSKYYKTSEFGGFNGDRFNPNGLAFNPVDQTFSAVPSKANLYYNDKNLRDFSLFETELGYPIAVTTSKAFNSINPSSMGFGIGISASQGGNVSFLNIENPFTSKIELEDLQEKEQIKAFPKAYGGGAVATGGRGGVVYLVNTLNYKEPAVFNTGVNGGNDYWTGGLYDAIANKTIGKRYVIFDVSGVIVGDVQDLYDGNDPNRVGGLFESGLFVKSVDYGYTILGQTAPKGGIAATKTWLSMDRVNNVVLRHFNVMPNLLLLSGDDITDSQLDTGIIIGGREVIVDHCESHMSGDKGIIVGSDEVGYPMINLTVQNSLVTDSATSMFSASNHQPAEIALGTDISWIYNASASSHRTPNLGGAAGYFEVQNNWFQLNQDVAQRMSNNNYSNHSVGYNNNIFDIVNSDDTILQNKVQTGSPLISAIGNVYRDDKGFALKGNQGEDNSIIFGDFSTDAPLPDTQFTKESFYGKIYNTAPLLNPLDTYKKIVNEVGANIYVSNDGQIGFYRNDYTAEAIEKIKRREGYLKRTSLWVIPTIENNVRPSNYYGDIKGIPIWFVEKFNITSIHEVIEQYVFDDFTYVNEAGYPAIEVFANYIAGDIQPYNIYENFTYKDIRSNVVIPSNLDVDYVLAVKNSFVETFIKEPENLKEGQKISFQQTGVLPIQFGFKDALLDSYVTTNGLGSSVEIVKQNNKYLFKGGLSLVNQVFEDVYLKNNAVSLFEAGNTLAIQTSNTIEALETVDTQDTDFAFRMTTSNGTSGNFNEILAPFTEIGDKVRISFWCKGDVNSTPRINNIVGFVEDPDISFTTGDWEFHEGVYTIDSETNVLWRLYIQPSDTDGSMLMHSFRVQKIYE